MKRLVVVLALMVAVPLVLMGCSDSESDTIEYSIDEFATAYNNEDYETCTGFLVGIDATNKETVKAALASGHQMTGDVEITSVEDITVDGSSATAKVTVTVQGQSQTNEISLSKVAGMWKFEGGDFFGDSGE
jgi:hypothetical protein